MISLPVLVTISEGKLIRGWAVTPHTLLLHDITSCASYSIRRQANKRVSSDTSYSTIGNTNQYFLLVCTLLYINSSGVISNLAGIKVWNLADHRCRDFQSCKKIKEVSFGIQIQRILIWATIIHVIFLSNSIISPIMRCSTGGDSQFSQSVAIQVTLCHCVESILVSKLPH